MVGGASGEAVVDHRNDDKHAPQENDGNTPFPLLKGPAPPGEEAWNAGHMGGGRTPEYNRF